MSCSKTQEFIILALWQAKQSQFDLKFVCLLLDLLVRAKIKEILFPLMRFL